MPAASEPDLRPADGSGADRGAKRGRIVLAVALALLTSILLQWRGRDLGRRDNGDWRRYSLSFATAPLGLAPAGAREGGRLYRPGSELDWHPRWQRKSPLDPPFSRLDTGSSYLLWLPGWILNSALLEPPILDLRLLGLPARILLAALGALLAAILALRAPPGRLWDVAICAAAVALAAIQADSSVISYANTFFRETASQVFALLLLTFLALPSGALERWRWGAAVALGATMISAPAHAFVLVPVLALLPTWERSPRRRMAFAFLALAVTGIGFQTLATVPGMARNAGFNAFFYGVVSESSDPEAQVRRAGLPEASVRLVGRRSFDAASRELLAGSPGPDHLDVLRAAGAEPAALLRLLVGGALSLGPGAGPPGARASGERAAATSILDAPWWRLNRLLAASGARALFLLGVFGALAIWSLARSVGGWERGLARLALFAALAAGVELASNLLGDGYSGVSRHLFLARILFDEALVFSLLLVLCRWTPRVSARSS